MSEVPFIILSQLREDCTTLEQSTPPQVAPRKPKGQEIRLDTPCVKCGKSIGEIGAGKGPHNASLRCKECQHFVKWISKWDLKKLNQIGGEA